VYVGDALESPLDRIGSEGGGGLGIQGLRAGLGERERA